MPAAGAKGAVAVSFVAVTVSGLPTTVGPFVITHSMESPTLNPVPVSVTDPPECSGFVTDFRRSGVLALATVATRARDAATNSAARSLFTATPISDKTARTDRQRKSRQSPLASYRQDGRQNLALTLDNDSDDPSPVRASHVCGLSITGRSRSRLPLVSDVPAFDDRTLALRRSKGPDGRNSGDSLVRMTRCKR